MPRSIPLERGEGGGTFVVQPMETYGETIELNSTRERERESYPQETDSLTKQGMKRVEERFYRVSVEPKQRYTRFLPLSLSLSS